MYRECVLYTAMISEREVHYPKNERKSIRSVIPSSFLHSSIALTIFSYYYHHLLPFTYFLKNNVPPLSLQGRLFVAGEQVLISDCCLGVDSLSNVSSSLF